LIMNAIAFSMLRDDHAIALQSTDVEKGDRLIPQCSPRHQSGQRWRSAVSYQRAHAIAGNGMCSWPKLPDYAVSRSSYPGFSPRTQVLIGGSHLNFSISPS
jgi:hypothetical protein